MRFIERRPGVFVREGDTAPSDLLDWLGQENPEEPIWIGGPGPGVIHEPGSPVRECEAWSVLDPESGQNEDMTFIIPKPDGGWEFI